MTDHITPQEARDDLDWARAVARSEAGGGEREDALDYLVLALETIAADQIEYGVEYTGRNTGHRFTGSDASWSPEQGLAAMEYRRMKKSGMNPRLVARRVSTPWEVTDDPA